MSDVIQESVKEKDIKSRFRFSRVLIALLIGLSVSGYLLYTNLTEVRFEKVAVGAGDFEWVDSNKDGQVDFTEKSEFKAKEGGNYIRHTYSAALQDIDWKIQTAFWLFLAVIMMVLRDVAYMARIRVLTEKELTWKQSFHVIMMWEFASALTPGVVGGAAVAMFILKKEKISLGKSTAIVLITAMLDNLFYLLMIPLALLFVGASAFFPDAGGQQVFGLSLNLAALFWIAYGIILLIFTIMVFGLFFKPVWLKRLLLAFFSVGFLRRWRHSALETGNEIVTTSSELKGKPGKYWLKAFGATVLSWTGRFLVINCIMAAFISTDVMDQLIIYARQLGMWVIMIISPTPGGSGIAEYTFSRFLDSFIPFGLTGILAVLWRLISYYPYLFIGSAILPRWIRGGKRREN